MYFCENNGNLSESKKMFSFPTLSQNENIFAWYDKTFSHNEQFLSRWDSQRAKQFYYSDKQKYTQNEQLFARFEYFFSHNENQEFCSVYFVLNKKLVNWKTFESLNIMKYWSWRARKRETIMIWKKLKFIRNAKITWTA